MRGRIIKGLGGLYDVLCEDDTRISCKARGILRHEGVTPYVGDFVLLSSDADGNYLIDSIEPRKNVLIRPPLANLDFLFMVIASGKPEPVIATVDKLISIAEFHRIEPVIVVSKTDVNLSYAAELSSIYQRCGFSVFPVSAKTGEGIGALHTFLFERLSCKSAAFAGASGVGKTTLMNGLFPELSLATGTVSEKISRGKHTTRHVQLYRLRDISDFDSDGFLADTPGFSMLDFVRFDFYQKEDLPYAFREFAPYLSSCRYADCTHTKEEGCAVLAAVERGDIPKSRHESFLAIYQDIKDKRPWNSK